MGPVDRTTFPHPDEVCWCERAPMRSTSGLRTGSFLSSHLEAKTEPDQDHEWSPNQLQEEQDHPLHPQRTAREGQHE